MSKTWLTAILGIFLIFGVTFAEKTPLALHGWVNDYADVISSEYRDKLTNLIQELEQKTTAEIFVVTIESIAPYGEQSYARMLFDSWKPGKKGKDNGVLVLLAIKERRWRIETGYGVEGILPDGLCGEIGRNYMVPYFKQGKYGEGLYYGVAAVARTISADTKTNLGQLEGVRLKKGGKGAPSPWFYFFFPLFSFIWNIHWPIFIGLPFTLFFAFTLSKNSKIMALLIISGYIGAMIWRYDYWHRLPLDKRKSLWKIFIFGLAAYSGKKYSKYRGWGGFGGGTFGGGSGGFGGGGGGCGGGGGAGGGF